MANLIPAKVPDTVFSATALLQSFTGPEPRTATVEKQEDGTIILKLNNVTAKFQIIALAEGK